MQSRANDSGGQEGEEHADDEMPCLRVFGQGDSDAPEPFGIDRQQRQDGAELDQDLETGAALEAQEMRSEQQMSGGRDGDEFGQALDNAEDDGFYDVEEVHESSARSVRANRSDHA